ncbi:sigma-70 family RNA polymerase sigma factor [uncultured Sunxiuqinia sp.]|uniref:sigma-70 family RNA polymerase sigma factor n=1 Tax=uncultured Sunxiuqinia sp. TaxID=1573825 RepID=UPI002AA74569|nr:sigma-70 family RNA polymerase sigma factor [uncultured Sunxiuqinia sp.]
MNSYIPHSDLNLVRSLRKSDHDAFEKLFKRYGQKLFIFSLSYLKDTDQAEEIVQEVFLKVWINRFSLKTGTSFQSYLFTIAFNSIKKSFNRKAKENQFRLELVDQLDDGRDCAEYEDNFQLVVTKLDGFINEMPERRKEVFIKRKQHGIPVKQIAEEFGVSAKTVENQITEAMKYLKKRFEEELPSGLLFFSLFLEN